MKSFWLFSKMKTLTKKQKKNKVGDVKKQEEVMKVLTEAEIKRRW